MKSFVLAVMAAFVVCLFCTDANAQLLRRNRGGGGGMGAAGSQLCNMANCPISAASCPSGSCNVQTPSAPQAPAAPAPASATSFRVDPANVARKSPSSRATYSGRHSFDVLPERPALVAQR